jgi:hypothetical protein
MKGVPAVGKVKNLLSEDACYDDDFSRGPGDPDVYGYPGEPQDPPVERKIINVRTTNSTSPISLSSLVSALGESRKASSNAYEAYKELKGIEDQARYELEAMLREMGLKSAKGQDFTASIAEKPTIIIKNEADIIDWLQNTPDVESNRYIGLKQTEFKSLAQAMLKGTGEVVPGTEVEVRESLSIRANKKQEAKA